MPQVSPAPLLFYAVTLAARHIEVTAQNDEEASEFGLDDAVEFAPNWNYSVADVAPAGAAVVPTLSISSVHPTVTITDRRPADSAFTLEATFPTIVMASSAYGAGEAALRMATDDEQQLKEILANYRYEVCEHKIRPLLLSCMQAVAGAFEAKGMESTLTDQGGSDIAMKITRPEGTVSVAVQLIAREEVSTNGDRSFGTYYALNVRDDDGEVIHSVQPVETAELWLNDHQLVETDIDWLDPREMIRKAAIGIRLQMDRAESSEANIPRA